MLEIFGEHTLSAAEMSGLLALSLALLAGYGIHASSLPFPLLKLKLFSIRTFRAAVSGSFFTRLGIGGVPFLLPLLYQVGLGFTPIQSGLLVMPQAIAAMSMKPFMPRLLSRIGYRGVLISNTMILGVLLMVFATIGLRTPVWVIVLQAFLYGAFTSLQYTSMNTLVYADIDGKRRQQCEFHRQHHAADVDQLRCGGGGLSHSVFRSQHALQSGRNDSGNP